MAGSTVRGAMRYSDMRDEKLLGAKPVLLIAAMAVAVWQYIGVCTPVDKKKFSELVYD